MKQIALFGFRVLIFLFSLIPFWILYGISNFISFIFIHIYAYRSKVICTNLSEAFPDKSEKEIKQIRNRYYRHLSDIIVESIKGFSISEKELLKRFKIVNPEVLDAYFDKNQSIIALGSHYGNWEWGAIAGGLQTKLHPVTLYKKLSNEAVDAHIQKLRARLGTEMIELKQTLRGFVRLRSKACVYILLADQNPSNALTATWITFLNQDTPCLPGPGKLSKRFKYPLVYFEVDRVKRGYYTLKVHELVKEPSLHEEKEMVELFFANLEALIRKKPEFWLWSHKRWKKKHLKPV